MEHEDKSIKGLIPSADETCLWICTCENFMEGAFHIRRVQRWSFHEHEAFFI